MKANTLGQNCAQLISAWHLSLTKGKIGIVSLLRKIKNLKTL